MAEYADLFLLAGVVLCVISVIVAIIQLLQTSPPRAAAILLIIGIVAIVAGFVYSPEPVSLEALLPGWFGSGVETAEPAPQ